MSASEESNQPNECELGSLAQYDSGDLSELVKKLQKDSGGQITEEEALKSVLQSQGRRPNTGYLEQLAAVASNPGLNQLNQVAHSTEPWLEILEQPKSKGIRFRYKCEGRSAGSIPGESSSNEHKTFPSVKIHNFNGPAAIVVVSCVTKDEPYRPHPHTLVGKECRKGVCTIKLKRSNLATFPNLGIQCVTKKEIKDSLKEREQIRVDPFGTGYFENINKLHLNIVRLCFQAFLPDDAGQYTRIVPPVVSQCIFDKKAVNDLVICRLSKQSGHAKGGDEVFMLCEKVNKDDIQVRFFEEVEEETVWESFADFSQSDVHRQFAIVFKTPPYKDQYISRPVVIGMQLFRPSDEGTSEPKTFQYIPNDPDPEGIEKKRKRKINFTSFMQDANPNTPAFSLLTDSIKETNGGRSTSDVKEKLKAKATRGRKPNPMGTFPQRPDIPEYILGNMEEVEVPPMSFQSPVNQVNVSEVVIQTTALGATIKAEDDSGDIMLDDLPVSRMIRDNLCRTQGNEEEISLPSLSNLPSFDMNTDIVQMAAQGVGLQSKLHVDSAVGGLGRLQTKVDSKAGGGGRDVRNK